MNEPKNVPITKEILHHVMENKKGFLPTAPNPTRRQRRAALRGKR